MLAEKCSAIIDVCGIPTHQYTFKQYRSVEARRWSSSLIRCSNCSRWKSISTGTKCRTAFNASKTSVLIDHHKSTDTSSYTLSWLDPTAVSTCSMIYELANAWKSTITSTIAEALYVGILFDTGGFQHSNTNAETLRIAATLMEFDFDANRTYIKVVKEKRLERMETSKCTLSKQHIVV